MLCAKRQQGSPQKSSPVGDRGGLASKPRLSVRMASGYRPTMRLMIICVAVASPLGPGQASPGTWHFGAVAGVWRDLSPEVLGGGLGLVTGKPLALRKALGQLQCQFLTFFLSSATEKKKRGSKTNFSKAKKAQRLKNCTKKLRKKRTNFSKIQMPQKTRKHLPPPPRNRRVLSAAFIHLEKPTNPLLGRGFDVSHIHMTGGCLHTFSKYFQPTLTQGFPHNFSRFSFKIWTP